MRRLSSKLVSRTTTRSVTSVSLELSSASIDIMHSKRETDSMTTRLLNVPRPRMSMCILADAADIDRAKQIDLEYMSVDDLKKCVLALVYIVMRRLMGLLIGSTRTRSS